MLWKFCILISLFLLSNNNGGSDYLIIMISSNDSLCGYKVHMYDVRKLI